MAKLDYLLNRDGVIKDMFKGADKLSYRSKTFMEAVIKLAAEICLG